MLQRMAVVLALAVGAVGAGEVIKDDEGRVLLPIAKVACVPLFEIKDVRAALCRVAGTPECAIVVKIVFLHHESNALEVTVTADMGGGQIFRKPVLMHYASRVKPNTPTTVCLLSPRALNSDPKFMGSITLTPQISFAFTPSPAQ